MNSNPALPRFPALSILFESRRTVRAIVDADPSHRVLLVSAFSGIGAWIAAFSFLGIEIFADAGATAKLLLLDGPILGWVGVYLTSRLLSWSSQAVFGGRATELEVRAAVAWVSTAWIWIGVLAFARQRAAGQPALVTALDLAAALLGVIALFALFRAVAEVERFSAWKTFLAGIVAVLALVLTLAIPVGSLALVLEFV